MSQEAAKTEWDDLLLPFLEAGNDAESESILERLITDYARPLVTEIVSFKLGASWRPPYDQDRQETEDITSEAIVRLVHALRRCKDVSEDKSITNLRGYVATIAYNCSDQYLRRKYPCRFSLKNRIKYVLTRRQGFALWDTDNQSLLSGFSSWQRARQAGVRSRRPDSVKLNRFLEMRFDGRSPEQVDLSDLLTGLFEFTEQPLEIDDLVSTIAELLDIRDMPARDIYEQMSSGERLVQIEYDARLEEKIDRRARLERVWAEVIKLPVRQRTALLLNLRDEQGGAAITLLPILQIASIKQIAEVLEIPPKEMFSIWNSLPMEDAAIAERLGGTRQQIANLRKCARERLSRRLQMQPR